MEEKHLLETGEIDENDWEQTPMSGMYCHSRRMVVSALLDYFGLKIGLGTVNRLRNLTFPVKSENDHRAGVSSS